MKKIKGINVNEKDKEGWTALHVACNEGNYKICEYLMERGGYVMSLNSSFALPIHYLVRITPESEGVWAELHSVLQKMLQHGTDVNAIDRYERNSLFFACTRARYPSTIDFLLNQQADINASLTYALLHLFPLQFSFFSLFLSI